jgi:hypothetical protein
MKGGCLVATPESEWCHTVRRATETSSDKAINGVIRAVAEQLVGGRQQLDDCLQRREVLQQKSSTGIDLFYFPTEQMSTKRVRSSEERITITDSSVLQCFVNSESQSHATFVHEPHASDVTHELDTHMIRCSITCTIRTCHACIGCEIEDRNHDFDMHWHMILLRRTKHQMHSQPWPSRTS